jgi:hypothetical protein
VRGVRGGTYVLEVVGSVGCIGGTGIGSICFIVCILATYLGEEGLACLVQHTALCRLLCALQ